MLICVYDQVLDDYFTAWRIVVWVKLRISAHLRFYPRNKFKRVEWFCNIIVRADRETLHPRQRLGFGGDKDDGNIRFSPYLLTYG